MLVSKKRNEIFRFDGTRLQPAEPTSYSHDGVQMASYYDEPFIIGDHSHSEIEFMHSAHQKWYTVGPFPSRDRWFGYATVSRPGKLFILGGCCENDDDDDDETDSWSNIWLFENDKWKNYGKLAHGRMNFITVPYGSEVLIIGGTSHDKQQKM